MQLYVLEKKYFYWKFVLQLISNVVCVISYYVDSIFMSKVVPLIRVEHSIPLKMG